MLRVRVINIIAWGIGIGIMPNGTWLTWGCPPMPDIPYGVPDADERFIDVCAQDAVMCGIRLNGTLVCGTDVYSPNGQSDKPWKVLPLTHDLFIIIIIYLHV